MTIREAADAIYDEAHRQGCVIERWVCLEIARRLLVGAQVVMLVRDRTELDAAAEDAAARMWIEESDDADTEATADHQAH
jgi:hypothetical protein